MTSIVSIRTQWHILFDILRRKKRYDSETLSRDEVSDKEHFYKSYRKFAASAF